MDDYLKDDNMDDVLDSIKQQELMMVNFMHLVIQNQCRCFYYNKKMFKEAGIDEASLPTLEKPWTWSEFNAVLRS